MSTYVEIALEYIARHGVVRSDRLAIVMRLDTKDVFKALQPSVDAGLLAVCKVFIPARNLALNEYRLAAGNPDQRARPWSIVDQRTKRVEISL